jgi:hypothetical protein
MTSNFGNSPFTLRVISGPTGESSSLSAMSSQK